MQVKWEDFEDLEITDVDPRDYPDFCDAFLDAGHNVVEDRAATEEELTALEKAYPEKINEMAYNSLI